MLCTLEIGYPNVHVRYRSGNMKCNRCRLTLCYASLPWKVGQEYLQCGKVGLRSHTNVSEEHATSSSVLKMLLRNDIWVTTQKTRIDNETDSPVVCKTPGKCLGCQTCGSILMCEGSHCPEGSRGSWLVCESFSRMISAAWREEDGAVTCRWLTFRTASELRYSVLSALHARVRCVRLYVCNVSTTARRDLTKFDDTYQFWLK